MHRARQGVRAGAQTSAFRPTSASANRACCVQGCCQFYCPYPSLRAPHCRGCNGFRALCCPALHTHGADYETLDESVELP